MLIDFPSGTVREWAGEPVVHRIDVDRALIESLIERHVEDWVNELFLSCRFRAHRDGPYNEYVYTFFKCLSVERMAYCEGYYASLAEPVDEMFRCGDYLVQKRCPHLRADLERFGTVHRRRARVQGPPLAVRARDGPVPHVRRRRAPPAHRTDRGMTP